MGSCGLAVREEVQEKCQATENHDCSPNHVGIRALLGGPEAQQCLMCLGGKSMDFKVVSSDNNYSVQKSIYLIQNCPLCHIMIGAKIDICF